jgi:hypothetical protein
VKLRSGKETVFINKENKPKKKIIKMANENGQEESNFDFKVFNSMIPTFRGNKTELRKFIDSGNLLFETLNDGGQEEFERLIMLKLDSHLYNWCQNKGIHSWEEIKDNLKRKNKTASNLPLLQKELFTIKQERRESVGQFAERVEGTLFEMNEIARGEIEEFDVGKYKHYHEILALRVFQDGLKDSLRMYIKARNYQTLSEAYTDDGIPEKLGKRNSNCFRCGRKGHIKTQCHARIDDQNRHGENRNRTNEWNKNNNFNRPNIRENTFQTYRNSHNPGNYHQGNFNNSYGNLSQDTGQYKARLDQRNVRYIKVENKSKNGESLVGPIKNPTK